MIQDDFKKFFEHFEKRLGMYIGRPSYDKLTSYISGISTGYMLNNKTDPFEGLGELICIKFGASRAIGPFDMLRQLIAKDEQEAITLFFRFVNELFEIKEIKGIDFIRSEYKKMGSLKRKRKTNLNLPKYK